MTEKKKTVYLIRHAESLENVAYKGARRLQASFADRKLPQIADIWEAFLLLFKLFRPSVLNSGLSELGIKQVQQLHHNLEKDNFLESLSENGEKKVAVVHSPLLRAKQTCYGALFGLDHMNDPEHSPCEVLPSLQEVNPMEIIQDAVLFRSEKTVDHRIRDFETWLSKQCDADTVVVVGHSVYFKRMLGLLQTFDNCDVWRLDFTTPSTNNNHEDNSALPRKWENMKQLYYFTPDPIPVIDEDKGETEPSDSKDLQDC